MSNPGIDAKLKDHFGLGAEDHEGLKQALGVDIRGVGARYDGPPLHEHGADFYRSCLGGSRRPSPD